MATENERGVLKLALEGKLQPQDVDAVEDRVFAEMVTKHAVSNLDLEKPNALDEVIVWLTEDDYRATMEVALEVFRDSVSPERAKQFGEELLQKLSEVDSRASVIRVFWRQMNLSSKELSREENLFYAINGDKHYYMTIFLKEYGFEPNVVQRLLNEDESLNEIPEDIHHKSAILVTTEELSDKVLENSWNPHKILPFLPLVSRTKVIEVLNNEELNDERLERIVKTLSKCRDDLKELGVQLVTVADNAKPRPGRPSMDDVAGLKSLRSRAKKEWRYQGKLNAMEIDILAYELPMKAKEAALAKALKAEIDGNVVDPFKVTELEDTLARVKTHIRAKAMRKLLEELAV